MANEQEFPFPEGSWGRTDSLHEGLPQGWEDARSSVAKRFARGAGTAASIGLNAAQAGLHAPGVANLAYTAAVGGAVAVSATGIGLIAAGGALAVGTSALAARSALKTHSHIGGLAAIQARWKTYECMWCAPGGRSGVIGDRKKHNYIGEVILPYIVQQKQTKLKRKGASIVPIIGSGAISLYSFGHAIIKELRGQRGKTRSTYAHFLAVHLITHHCELCDAIVGELYTPAECDLIKRMNSDDAGDVIMQKMKSI